MTAPYQMDVETAEGVKTHGFHLGTEPGIARGFVFERLRQPGVRSVRLYRPGTKISQIFDYRDLPENEEEAYD